MQNSITIRIATAADAEAIALLSNGLLDMHADRNILFRTVPGYEQYSADYIRSEIELPNTKFFLACDDNKIIGYAMVMVMDRPKLFQVQKKGNIATTYIDDEYRSRGVGKLLIDAIKNWLRSEKVTVIDLMVTRTNPRGQKFWEEQGFEPLNQHMVCDLGQ
jgi:ribosomal protein S18 acetylase RimI-like enzyme